MEGTLSYFPTLPGHVHHERSSSFFISSFNVESIAMASSTANRKHEFHCGITSNSTEMSPVSAPPRSRKNGAKVNIEVSPHRAVAAVRLLRIEQGGAFTDLLCSKGRNAMKNENDYVERTLGFRIRDLENRDARLVSDIVGGSTRWKRYLDHLIMSLCNSEKTFRGMEPLLLQILRIGFFEILKLGMPPYAVVNENVRLAKVCLRPGAGNMVNGILRKLVLLKEKHFLPLPKVEGDEQAQACALATIHSHPVWMVRRWIKSLGKEEAVKLMEWNNNNPSFCLRVNPQKGYTRATLVMKLTDLKVPHKLSTYLNDFVRLQTGMQTIIQAGLLKEGFCSVQDESAGLVVSIVDPLPGETIIDCCAAPGGKAVFMASRLRSQGRIWAVDINKARLRLLTESSKLHNVDAVITSVNADLRFFSENLPLKADKVLLDTPCSGLGVLSKRADLRWNKRLEDLVQLKQLQDQLLDSASRLVKPGGILIYSTCSIDPEENEERIEAFLLRHQEFAVDPLHRFVPAEFITSNGFFSSDPIKHSMDGAFAARLIRSMDS